MSLKLKKHFIIVLLVLLFVIYLSLQRTLISHIATRQDKPITRLSSKIRLSSKEHPLILYWGSPWGQKGYTRPDGTKWGECVVTNDRSQLKQADIVLFHYTVVNHEMMPWKNYRNPNQVFVWWSAENPAMLLAENIDLTHIERGFFNWTFTYRLDADVYGGYGYRGNLINHVSRGQKAVDEIMAAKTKLAIWFVSNCDKSKGARMRFKYSQKLIEAGLNFTRIGKCFGNQHLLPRGDGNAIAQTVSEHKFYMTFENAWHCKDYITEKFWETALLNGAVPVIWGPTKIDVLRVAPIDSFIHVEDFESPAKLVEYLQYLDKHDLAYREYFRWREDENMTDENMISMIRKKYPNIEPQTRPISMCEKFLQNTESKSINSLYDEFVLSNPNVCYETKQSWLKNLKYAILGWAAW